MDKTAVYGFDGVETAVKGGFHGVTDGSEVPAHYTGEGARYSAVSVRRVGVQD